MTTIDDFETHRRELMGLAYRLLGTVGDAEDMVQETFLRWRQAGEPRLDHPKAWFTRTCTRLCLDRLKSAQMRREEYVGVWLPEPFQENPADQNHAELAESLSMALLLTLERLRPAERAAFLLREVFDHDYEEIAAILDLHPPHCRQLVSRARKSLAREDHGRPASPDEVERLSSAFFDAIDRGDLVTLRSVLADDVVLRSDGGGKVPAARRPIFGIEPVVRFLGGVFRGDGGRLGLDKRSVALNGSPGLVLIEEGRIATAFQFDVEDGSITRIFAQRNPDKLARLEERLANPG